jgi:N-acetylglutamate synthase-like GNAT family acetyltransferase
MHVRGGLLPVSGPEIRAGTADDRAAVEALVGAAGLPLAGLDECVAAATVVVADEDGRVVGVAATERHGPSTLLRSVVVGPAARRRGLGRALVDRALADARDAGAREAWLLTETATGWFIAGGWSLATRAAAPPAIAASVEFTTACPASADALRREL